MRKIIPPSIKCILFFYEKKCQLFNNICNNIGYLGYDLGKTINIY